MKRNKLLALSILAVMVFSAGSLSAQMKPGKGDRRGGPMPPKDGCMERHHGPHGPFFGDPNALKARLKLTDEQVSKISAINLEYKKQFMSYHEKIAPKHIKLRKTLLDDNVDLKDVRSQLKEISDLQLETRMLMIQHRLDIEKALTPEQRIRLKGEREGMKMNCPPPDMGDM
jgi:Spy/CpxP family protein refolding chaperone